MDNRQSKNSHSETSELHRWWHEGTKKNSRNKTKQAFVFVILPILNWIYDNDTYYLKLNVNLHINVYWFCCSFFFVLEIFFFNLLYTHRNWSENTQYHACDSHLIGQKRLSVCYFNRNVSVHKLKWIPN